jgi:hypothetical protein
VNLRQWWRESCQDRVSKFWQGKQKREKQRRISMKIEIGESLMLSYLKHIKKCRFYQTNWKISSNWDIDENSNDKLLFVYDNIIKHSEFSEIFKQSKLEQLIKQSEIDVIGWDGNDKIYVADIAFHEAGLNYGSKIETKNRVFKKLLRSYLTLLAYFPDKKYELIFASPKVHNATENIINDYFNVLNKDFSEENVEFKYISNDFFRDEIFIPAIEKTKIDSDTNELFIRAIKLSNLFKMLTNKPIDTSPPEIANNHNTINNWVTNNDEFSLEFIPSDEKVFKQKLIETKRAKRTWYYKNKNPETDIWDASNFTVEANLRGNIFSNNKVRARKDTGLIKVKFEILNG